jgi:N-acetylglucosaminyl-diphospho-decaprenol L-rhamnosyltransferase
MSAGPEAETHPPGDGEADLAVVVVNHNSGHFLARCLRSIVENRGEARVDVVVVDNASGDGSDERALAAVPETRLIPNAGNLGFPAAANQGIAATTAPFVFLLNPDAMVLAGTLGGFLKVAGDHPRAGAIGCLTRNPDGSIYPSARKIPSLREAVGHSFVHPFKPDNRWSRAYTMAGWDRLSERQAEWVSGSSVLLRRAALDEVGLFDAGRYFMYVEDVDLCTRLRHAGWEVWYSPELEVEHEVGSATKGSKRMTLEHSRSAYRYFEKFRATGWKRALLPLAWVALRLRAAVASWRRGER